VRAGDGPAFLECRTYRFAGHSRSDPATYRKPGELERWRERDPLRLASAALRDGHGVGAVELDALAARVAEEVDACWAAALAAPFPDPGAVHA
jgi:TPP-dependent pyruvate/acetoin dehydrogenase alpha subunit